MHYNPQSSNSSKFLVCYLSVDRVLAGQSLAWPDKVQLDQTMSDQPEQCLARCMSGVFKPPTVVFLLGLYFSHPNRQPPLQNFLLRQLDLPRESKVAHHGPSPPGEPSPPPS
jgi:hypothetical protein